MCSIRWALYDNFEFSTSIWGLLTFWGSGGTKTQRRAAILGQRIYNMTCHLIFACQLARPKSAFLGLHYATSDVTLKFSYAFGINTGILFVRPWTKYPFQADGAKTIKSVQSAIGVASSDNGAKRQCGTG